MTEKFNSQVLEIVSKAIDKSRAESKSGETTYHFSNTRIQYGIKGDVSPLNDGSDRVLFVESLNVPHAFHEVYIKLCHKYNKQYSLTNMIMTCLFINLLTKAMDTTSGERDIHFRVNGFLNREGMKPLIFNSSDHVCRIIVRKYSSFVQGFDRLVLRDRRDPNPAIEIANESGASFTLFPLTHVGNGQTVVGYDQLADYFINYM